MHCHTTVGQWAVGLLRCAATLLRSRGPGGSCSAVPHCSGVMGSGTLSVQCRTAAELWAVGLLLCIATLLGAVGGGTPQYTATVLGSSRQWDCFGAPPHRQGVVGNGAPSVRRHTSTTLLASSGQWESLVCCHTPGEQWAAELMQHTSRMLGNGGQWESSALPTCGGAAGSGTPSVLSHTTREQCQRRMAVPKRRAITGSGDEASRLAGGRTF